MQNESNKSSPGNVKTATIVQPLLSRACRPTDCAPAKIILWIVIASDSTRGKISMVGMKNSPDGLVGVSGEKGLAVNWVTDGSDDFLCILFLYV